MPKFTLETTYHLPVYRHRTIEAENLARACRLAIEDDDWSAEKSDYESAGETFVSGAWEGEDAYHGATCAVPSHYAETEQRKAAHFDALLAILKEPARPMGLSIVEFARWLPRAVAVIAKAEAILEGRPDPEEADFAGARTVEEG